MNTEFIKTSLFTALAGCLLSAPAPAAAQGGSTTSSAVVAASEVKPAFNEREQVLLRRIERLERRLAQLESRATAPPPTPASGKLENGSVEVATSPAIGLDAPQATGSQTLPAAAASATQLSADDRGVLDFFRGTTFNLTMDGYYAYNFNRPAGHINLLRAYDVSSNSFSLNQATMILEQAPDVSKGRRFGLRLDLQYGQATETLQGSASNEPRPQVYRPIFQAYGSYIAPIGKGLQVDFGKWASPLGVEGNYSKDQLNYSRSYLFNFLPFYHFGVRATYEINPKLTAAYWLVNGIQQSEDFNDLKSQALILTIKPTAKISWNVNYYTGVEGRSIGVALNPGAPTLPTQPGLSATNIKPAPDGREHIFDTYVTWNATPRLALVGEGDYVINRVFRRSANQHLAGGAAYAQYKLTPRLAIAGRGEYLSDRGGLFSGSNQALKEATLTFDYKVADGFLVRSEWRRDFLNHPFFLSDVAGRLKKEQNTATLGLVWWLGRKQGAW